MIEMPVLLLLTSAALAGTPTWQPGPALPVNVAERTWAVGLNVNGALYALGGTPWRNPGDDDGAVHRLSSGASSWTELPAFDGLGPFIFQGGGVDNLGRIVIFGGELIDDPEEQPQDPFEYDPIDGPTGNLTDRSASAPYARFAWCTDSQHRIYSLGGGLGADGSNSTRCERYDGALDTWQVIAPMNSAVADAAAACDGSRILVFGGFTATGAARTANVALYDIAANAWSDTAAPDMPVALSGARAVVGADGRWYVLGGASGPVGSESVQDSVWVLEADLSAWSPGPPMAEPRQWFAAALGSDHHIYVIGGDNDTGGTTGVEKLETIPCPTFVQSPEDQQAWSGSVAGFNALATGGGTITYQWSRDGSHLTDGPTGTGSEVIGAASASVGILNPSTADEGVYTVSASNSCGLTHASTSGTLIVSAPTTLLPNWQVVNLHPSWGLSSRANAIDEGITAGSVTATNPTYGSLAQAAAWTSDSAAAINLTPGNSVGSEANDFDNGVAVGWYWRPYSCQGGQTCYFKVAAKWSWNGASWAFTDIHSYPEYDYAVATDGTTHVGYSWSDEPLYTSRYVVWPSTGSYQTFDGSGRAVEDGVAYGAWSSGSVAVAARWTFLPTVRTTLAPPGTTASVIVGAGSDQQVGSATIGGVSHPWLWASAAGGSRDMLPTGVTSASLNECEQGLQVGSYVSGATGRAAIWSGSPDAFVDLHQYVPAGFTTSAATAIDAEAPDGVLRVVGYGYNASTSRIEALMWINVPLDCPGDADGDGLVNFDDLNLVLANWNSAGPEGDADHSGFVDFDDLNLVLTAWQTTCL